MAQPDKDILSTLLFFGAVLCIFEPNHLTGERSWLQCIGLAILTLIALCVVVVCGLVLTVYVGPYLAPYAGQIAASVCTMLAIGLLTLAWKFIP